jgi:hypothetical protein
LRELQPDPVLHARLRRLLEEIESGTVDLKQVRSTLTGMIAADPSAGEENRPESR